VQQLSTGRPLRVTGLSPESPYELALNQLEVPVSARYQVEDAIDDLAEAVKSANEGSGLEALIEVACL
jgi:hypothetical protein